MATDATGAPTPLGIPKYNPAVDAPSGLGFNAAMDSIDTLVAAKVSAPAGIASGEVPVWNGTTWVRSTTTKIGRSSLGGVPIDTALPGSPVNEQEALLTDSLTAPTYMWLFRYVSGISDSYKWVCIGGTPKQAEVATSETTTSTSYADLTTSGPAVTLPRAGIYKIDHGAQISGGGVLRIGMSYAVGATAAANADETSTVTSAASAELHTYRANLRTFTSAVALTAKYKTNTGTATFSARYISMMPVRVS